MVADTLLWCRAESKGGDERSDFNGQVGEGRRIRGRRGQRVRKGEGESGWIHDHVFVSRIHVGNVLSCHGLIVRVRFGEMMHAAMQRRSVIIRQVFHTDFRPTTLLLGNECG